MEDSFTAALVFNLYPDESPALSRRNFPMAQVVFATTFRPSV